MTSDFIHRIVDGIVTDKEKSLLLSPSSFSSSVSIKPAITPDMLLLLPQFPHPTSGAYYHRDSQQFTAQPLAQTLPTEPKEGINPTELNSDRNNGLLVPPPSSTSSLSMDGDNSNIDRDDIFINNNNSYELRKSLDDERQQVPIGESKANATSNDLHASILKKDATISEDYTLSKAHDNNTIYHSLSDNHETNRSRIAKVWNNESLDDERQQVPIETKKANITSSNNNDSIIVPTQLVDSKDKRVYDTQSKLHFSLKGRDGIEEGLTHSDEPMVTINIGRIEVRSIATAATVSSKTTTAQKHFAKATSQQQSPMHSLSLYDYLRMRSEGRL